MTAEKKAVARRRETKPAGGRPTSYKEEYAKDAYRLTLLGLKDTELAEFFGIAEQTLNNWKKKHPEFMESLKEGREVADGKVVASLYHRAIGYSHPEDKIFNNDGEPMVVPTTKHYPPDVGAIALWLKNRQRDRWNTSQNDSGDNNTQINITITGKDALL